MEAASRMDNAYSQDSCYLSNGDNNIVLRHNMNWWGCLAADVSSERNFSGDAKRQKYRRRAALTPPNNG